MWTRRESFCPGRSARTDRGAHFLRRDMLFGVKWRLRLRCAQTLRGRAAPSTTQFSVVTLPDVPPVFAGATEEGRPKTLAVGSAHGRFPSIIACIWCASNGVTRDNEWFMGRRANPLGMRFLR